jgi:hypothetical protein
MSVAFPDQNIRLLVARRNQARSLLRLAQVELDHRKREFDDLDARIAEIQAKDDQGAMANARRIA